MNVLIVGLGSMGKKHVEALQFAYPNTVIMALRSGKSSDGSVNGVIDIYDWKNVPYKPDFVIISNPTYLHDEVIIRAIEMGVPIMIEKPVLSSLHRVNELSSLITKRGIVTYVACNLRFHPSLLYIKKNIALEKLNEINIYCGSYLPDWRPGRNFKETYSAKAEEGGGVHLDLIHEIDYCFWLFGKPKSGNSIKRNVSSLNISGYDYANYIFQYEHFTANITLNYYRRDSKRVIELLFEDTTWEVNLNECEIIDSEHQVIFAERFNIRDTYVAQMKYFVSCIENKLMPMNTFQEAVEVLKLCLL